MLDCGNTQIKAAVFNSRELIRFKPYSLFEDVTHDSDFLTDVSRAIIGTVTTLPSNSVEKLNTIFSVYEFTNVSKIPLKNGYKSRSTLGSDRLAASIGAYALYPNKNTLVIDAGTCLKFNFTSANGEYLGGAISPGLEMRFKSLQQYTDKLPLINFRKDFTKLTGQTTEESILSGVMNGILFEADTAINEYKKQYPDLITLLTGGDSDFFAKRLKNSIFAHPHLVLNGLNEILIYNS